MPKVLYNILCNIFLRNFVEIPKTHCQKSIHKTISCKAEMCERDPQSIRPHFGEWKTGNTWLPYLFCILFRLSSIISIPEGKDYVYIPQKVKISSIEKRR